MRIILLEFIDEARAILDRHGRSFFQDKACVTVALHPKVRAFLKQEGIEAQDSVRYLPNSRQHHIVNKVEEITIRCVAQIRLTDQWGIEKGYEEFFFHHFRLYAAHFLWLIEILKGIHQEHSPTEIHAVLPVDPETMCGAGRYIQDRERFLGFVAQSYAEQHGIAFHKYQGQKAQGPSWEKRAAPLVRTVACKIMNWELKRIYKNLHADQPVIVVPALSYRMDVLIKEIRRRHPRCKVFMIWEGNPTLRNDVYKSLLIGKNIRHQRKEEHVVDGYIHLDLLKNRVPVDTSRQSSFREAFEIWINDMEANQGLFAEDGVNYWSLLKPKLQCGLLPALLELQHSTDVLTSVLQKLSPRLLMSMYSVTVYYMMGELGTKLNYETLNITHGTHVPPNNSYEKIENYRLATSVISNTYKYVSVQTPWADKFLDYYGDTRERLYTGPLLFSVTDPHVREKMRREIFGDEHRDLRLVLHASTQKARNGLRFHITETLDEYVQTLCDLVNAVNELEDVRLIIRPHPVCNLTEAEFRTLLPDSDRYRIVTKGSFSPVLSMADLLVSYSSTCIEEALQNRIPVLLYDRWKRYNHFGVPEVAAIDPAGRTPVSYFTQPDLLQEEIGRLLDVFQKRALSDAELTAYKYPPESRERFFQFINQTLGQEVMV